LLPVPPSPAPPLPTVSQTPVTGPPLLPLPPPTVSNVVHKTRPINLYNINININPNNLSDNDETDNESTDHNSDETDHDSDETDHDSDAPMGFANFFANYFFS
jgi:hypothetical protein